MGGGGGGGGRRTQGAGGGSAHFNLDIRSVTGANRVCLCESEAEKASHRSGNNHSLDYWQSNWHPSLR